MNKIDLKKFENAIRRKWSKIPGSKAINYIGKFFNRKVSENKIKAKTEGNYGTYNVSITYEENEIESTCSCYIGKEGYCHHCEALAYTYLKEYETFEEIKAVKSLDIKTPESIKNYLQNITLDSLLLKLKEKGISQKEFAEIIGMNPRKLTTIKSSELQNRYYNELGAVKLACLWLEANLKTIAKTK